MTAIYLNQVDPDHDHRFTPLQAEDGTWGATSGCECGAERTAYPYHPEISVQLVGRDGNAFAILGAVQTALRKGGVSAVEIDAFFTEATAGDYDNLLATAMRWVDVS